MSGERMFALVTKEQATTEPYPYVFVNSDGAARELHPSEKRYLETPFSPFDGGSPYVKASFLKKDGWNSLQGFLQRSEIPDGIVIQPAPSLDPVAHPSKEDLIERMRNHGFELKSADGGRMSFVRTPKSDR